jgi:HEAT repeat protein
MRDELRRWQLSTRDAGFLTEPQMWARLNDAKTPWDVARDSESYARERLLEAAGAVGQPDSAKRQRQWLHDDDDGVRYWAAVGLHAAEKLSEADRTALREALRDESAVVRIEAAAALASHDEPDTALPVLSQALKNDTPEVVLHAARALELLGSIAHPANAEMRVALAKARERELSGDDIAMFIRFSLEAALSRTPPAIPRASEAPAIP